MRRIAIVTVGRSDYSYWKPILDEIGRRNDVEAKIIAGDAHFLSEFGNTAGVIEADGRNVDAKVDTGRENDSPLAVARSTGTAVAAFAAAYDALRPQLVMVLGDRYEMLAAAIAAVPLGLPLGHIAGGELTEGAIDDSFRHAITKLSHLHFVALPAYSRRVMQLGEEPWRVMVTGAPTLDNLRHLKLLSKEDLEREFQVDLSTPTALVTFHPVTRELDSIDAHTTSMLDALSESGLRCVFTAPNADPLYRRLLDRIEDFVKRNDAHRLVRNFGTLGYYSMMKHATVMIGNSSSGIIESASFHLPVVNIGSRQAGRFKPPNVIDAAPERQAIAAAIRRAASPGFRAGLSNLENPYGDGHAAERIVERIATIPIDRALLTKRFVDLSPVESVST